MRTAGLLTAGVLLLGGCTAAPVAVGPAPPLGPTRWPERDALERPPAFFGEFEHARIIDHGRYGQGNIVEVAFDEEPRNDWSSTLLLFRSKSSSTAWSEKWLPLTIRAPRGGGSIVSFEPTPQTVIAIQTPLTHDQRVGPADPVRGVVVLPVRAGRANPTVTTQSRVHCWNAVGRSCR